MNLLHALVSEGMTAEMRDSLEEHLEEWGVKLLPAPQQEKIQRETWGTTPQAIAGMQAMMELASKA